MNSFKLNSGYEQDTRTSVGFVRHRGGSVIDKK